MVVVVYLSVSCRSACAKLLPRFLGFFFLVLFRQRTWLEEQRELLLLDLWLFCFCRGDSQFSPGCQVGFCLLVRTEASPRCPRPLAQCAREHADGLCLCFCSFCSKCPSVDVLFRTFSCKWLVQTDV